MLITKITAGVCAGLLTALDLIIKMWAARVLPFGRAEVIPGFFYLTYVENRGASFGMFYGHSNLLAGVTGVIMAVMLCYICFSKSVDKAMIRLVMLILAGGLGNLIDRVARGFVVDYLDFSAVFGFPVFNLADCCIVIGCILLAVHVFRLERGAKRRGAEDNG
ncbi:MAG: signal peptidase II [Oscillospiraceae bacterium]|nr:signal peptidase II [Oscillospiraceae bacterium]